MLVQEGHAVTSGQPQCFSVPKNRAYPRVLLPGVLSKTQTEPGKCRGILCHSTLLFGDNNNSYYSLALDLPCLLYLLSPAASDQSLHIDLSTSALPTSPLALQTPSGTLSLSSP